MKWKMSIHLFLKASDMKRVVGVASGERVAAGWLALMSREESCWRSASQIITTTQCASR